MRHLLLLGLVLAPLHLPLAWAPGCDAALGGASLGPSDATLAAAHDAGLAGLLLPDGARRVPEACEGVIRPGAPLTIDGTRACTAGWLLRDEGGAWYLTTAGHCIPSLLSRVAVQGLGEVGEPVYTTGDAGIGHDFAVVRIFEAMEAHVDPTLCHWGGPRGVASPGGAEVEEVLHYGWGALYGQAAASRARVALLDQGGWDEASVAYLATTNAGDSGMPLMASDGRAIGIHTHTTLASAPGAGAGLKHGMRLDVALERARAEVGRGLALAESGAPVRFGPPESGSLP